MEKKEVNYDKKRKRNRSGNEDEKLIEPIVIKYSKKQLEILNKKSEKSGIRLSTLIRELSLKNNINITSKFDISTYNQIRKIGVNINQVARKINASFNTNEINREYNSLLSFIEELKNILKNK